MYLGIMGCQEREVNMCPRKRSALRRKGLVHGAHCYSCACVSDGISFPEHNGRRGDSFSCQAGMYSVCWAPGGGVFLSPFQTFHLSKCPSGGRPAWEAINSEGRARSQEDEAGGHSYLHKQLTGTRAKPGRGRLDNDLDNEAIHCCREWSKWHFTLSACVNSIFLHYTSQLQGGCCLTFAEQGYL